MQRFVLRAAIVATLALVLPSIAFADEPAPVPPSAPPTGEKPTEKPTDKPTEKPTDKPADKPTEAPAASAGVVFEAHDLPFADALAKAQAATKPVFVDFSTDWCGWCRRLEKDVFSREDVDAEKGEGIELAKRYAAHGFPTLVVVDAAGDEVDRIVGYLPGEKFLTEIARIRSGEGTLPALKAKVAASPDDAEAVLAYAEKVSATKPAEADGLLEALGEKVKGKDRPLEAKVLGVRARLAEETGDAAKAGALCDRILEEFADTEAAAGALANAVNVKIGTKGDFAAGLAVIEKVRSQAKDGRLPLEAEMLAAKIHAAMAGVSLARAAAAAGDDAERLNEVAWTAFEMRSNLRAAIGWARKAVTLSKEAPEILDPLANLLAATGKLDEAIELEEKAAAKLEGAMRAGFDLNIAKWKAERDALKAAGAVPATPVEPAKDK
jgi:thiol-disulfide isomerase/thioredoxin